MLIDQENKVVGLSSDRPITKPADDKFQRAAFAKLLAAQILALPKEDSFVIGLSGPWGSGKTSILNLIESELAANEEVVVVWFNPWLFSGTSELMEHFFAELAAQIAESKPEDSKRGQVAGTISSWLKRLQGMAQAGSSAYAQAKGHSSADSAVVGAAAAMAVGAVADKLQGIQQSAVTVSPLEGSLRKQRKQLEKLLVELGRRIIVILDDLDRLHASEVQEVIRLVRLTADFPNVYYLLAFDRFRVEKALGDNVEHGRSYLEKIFQVIFDLPPISHNQMQAFLANEVNRTLSTTKHGPEHEGRLLDVFRLGMAPLFRQPRDVRRFMNTLKFTLEAVQEEVAVADILALETIRTLLPDTFSLLVSHRDFFATSIFSMSQHTDKEGKAIWKAAVDSAPGQQLHVAKLLSLLFPATNKYSDQLIYENSDWLSKWRCQRRVASLEYFEHYLNKVLPEGSVRPSYIESLVNAFGDSKDFSERVKLLSSEEFSWTIMRLEDYEDRFISTESDLILAQLINIASSYLTENPHTPDYAFSPHFRLLCIVFKWLKKITSPDERYQLLKSIFSKVNSISWKLDLLSIAKTWNEDQYSKKPLIPPESAEELATVFALDVVQALQNKTQDLLSEKRLLDAISIATQHKPESIAAIRELAKQDEFLVSLIANSISLGYQQAIGSSFRQEFRRLPWRTLQELFGAEFLSERVSYLIKKQEDPVLKSALTLALDYATGKRAHDEEGPLVDSNKNEEAPEVAPGATDEPEAVEYVAEGDGANSPESE